VPPDVRDAVVDFVRAFTERTELATHWVLAQLTVAPTQFYRWTARYGRVNTHNGQTPRDHWLTPEERAAILGYHDTHAPEGYRRMTFMMLDADIVAVSPATVYRVLKAAANHRAKARASSNRSSRTSTGTSISATSTWPAPSTTCARSWMGQHASSCTGNYASA
jgi:hypothetical protein